MTLNALAGLPRSGSTLLANILEQHPDVHVSPTSTLVGCVGAVQQVLTSGDGVPSELAGDPEMLDRYRAAVRGLTDGWYSTVEEPVIIDKGRGWPSLWLLALDVWDDPKMIVTVRDPRDVIASIERQHRKTAVIGAAHGPMLRESAELMMGPDGLVGTPMRWIEDLIRRGVENVLFVRYESMAVDPKPVLDRTVEHLGLSAFEFDVDDVLARTPVEEDAVWRYKFPHDGTGVVKPPEGHWSDMMDDQLAADIAGVCPLYMASFMYS